jgi:poly-gamma-glutamate system protein
MGGAVVKWKPTRVSKLTLLLLSVVSLGVLAAVERFQRTRERPYLPEKLTAARKMQQAIEAVAEARAAAGHEFDPNTDPRRTGLIGLEFSPITNDRGVLAAKQIVTNPNFAALVVELFRSAGVKRGDTIAVGWTGSLPGANLAVLAAAETLQLRVVAVHSVAASMYGANDPSFTWLDMEKLLADRGIFRTRSVAASLGGDEDRGKGMGNAGRDLIRQAIGRAGVTMLREPTFEQQIAARMRVYQERAGRAPVKLYVNVGGGIGSLGARINGLVVRPGLSRSFLGTRFGRDGAMTLMAKRGVPVVHINYISRLCQRYGFPDDPWADPTPGAGPMFRRGEHDLWLTGSLLVALLALFFVTIRLDMRYYVRRQKLANEMV